MWRVLYKMMNWFSKKKEDEEERRTFCQRQSFVVKETGVCPSLLHVRLSTWSFFSYKSRRKVERITQTSCSSVSCFSVPFNFDYTVYVKYVFIFSWKKDKTKIESSLQAEENATKALRSLCFLDCFKRKVEDFAVEQLHPRV